MTLPNLEIRGAGRSFAILQGRKVLARATSHGNAVAHLPALERRLQAQSRPCMACTTPFQSRGKHHRLCPTCGKGA